MKIIIQHNWTTGLGDFFCAVTEYLNFIKPLKEKGFETKLIFSINGRSGSNKFIGDIKFEQIINLDSIKEYFDNVETINNSIIDNIIDGCKYLHTQYGPKEPGHHWWDVFSDENLNGVSYPNYNPSTYLNGTQIPSIYPKFVDKVYEKEKKFLEKIKCKYNFTHIRFFDYRDKEDFFIDDLKWIVKNISNSTETFHIGSNSQYALNEVVNLNNSILFDIGNLDLFSNDHPYYFYNKHIDNGLLLDRLYDNIAEMVSVRNSEKIYYYSSFGWVSNFLFYGISQNEKINSITQLNKDIKL
jgi:hypothetical protein